MKLCLVHLVGVSLSSSVVSGFDDIDCFSACHRGDVDVSSCDSLIEAIRPESCAHNCDVQHDILPRYIDMTCDFDIEDALLGVESTDCFDHCQNVESCESLLDSIRPGACAYNCEVELDILPRYVGMACEFDISAVLGQMGPGTIEVRSSDGFGVEAGVPFTPEVLVHNEWHEICGHWFWNNHNGATAVCNKFGFSKGYLQEERWEDNDWSGSYLLRNGIMIGQCNEGESLEGCSGNWNTYDVSGGCMAGDAAGIAVTCTNDETSLGPCAIGCGAAAWATPETCNNLLELIQAGGCAHTCQVGSIQRSHRHLRCEFDIASVLGNRPSYDLEVRARGNADVLPRVPFVPEILFNDGYHEICGHWFWNNHNGATSVCRKLGFQSGRLQRERWHDHSWWGATLETDAVMVGSCGVGSSLEHCAENENRFDVGGGGCRIGDSAGIMVICADNVEDPGEGWEDDGRPDEYDDKPEEHLPMQRCWNAGYRDFGDESGLFQCPEIMPISRDQDDGHLCPDGECDASQCCAQSCSAIDSAGCPAGQSSRGEDGECFGKECDVRSCCYVGCEAWASAGGSCGGGFVLDINEECENNDVSGCNEDRCCVHPLENQCQVESARECSSCARYGPCLSSIDPQCITQHALDCLPCKEKNVMHCATCAPTFDNNCIGIEVYDGPDCAKEDLEYTIPQRVYECFLLPPFASEGYQAIPVHNGNQWEYRTNCEDNTCSFCDTTEVISQEEYEKFTADIGSSPGTGVCRNEEGGNGSQLIFGTIDEHLLGSACPDAGPCGPPDCVPGVDEKCIVFSIFGASSECNIVDDVLNYATEGDYHAFAIGDDTCRMDGSGRSFYKLSVDRATQSGVGLIGCEDDACTTGCTSVAMHGGECLTPQWAHGLQLTANAILDDWLVDNSDSSPGAPTYGSWANGNGHESSYADDSYAGNTGVQIYGSWGDDDSDTEYLYGFWGGEDACGEDCEEAPDTCAELILMIQPGGCANDCMVETIMPMYDVLGCEFAFISEIIRGDHGGQ